MPLDVVARVVANKVESADSVLMFINDYVRHGDTNNLVWAIRGFCYKQGIDVYTAMLEASIQYEDGCKKYGERNWEKGQPLSWYINSGGRHYLKTGRGDKDEPHNRAFLWNMIGAIWTHEHKPELIDLPFAREIAGGEKV